jgi:hypothetical protein
VVVKRKSAEDEHGYSREDAKSNIKKAKIEISSQPFLQKESTFGIFQ